MPLHDQEALVAIASLRAEIDKLHNQTRVLPDGTVEYHGDVGPLELLRLVLADCLELVRQGDLPLFSVTAVVAGEEFGPTMEEIAEKLEID